MHPWAITADRLMIYGAIIYTILPMDLIPASVYRFLGILDDGVAILFVYNKIKEKILELRDSGNNAKL